MLQCGDIVNERYKIVKLLGKGGLSYVYEVEDLQLPRKWALKEFNPRQLKEDEIEKVRQQFKQEIELLSRLKHERLPEVSDAFVYEGKDYMVMELIAGETLKDLILKRAEPYDEGTVKKWALQILDILQYLHSQDPPIIYRDVKPENIIIDPEIGVRFIDFGIARLFNPVKQQDTIFMGTPGFAAPEQFRQRQTDVRSDLYSFGATLHYLLTLKDPGMNPFDFEQISLANPKVGPLMEKVVARCLEIKPENRFQNTIDIRRVLAGEVAFDDLFQRNVVIINPRELVFTDLQPFEKHLATIKIEGAGGERITGRLTSDHPGVMLDHDRVDGPSDEVLVTLDNPQFPRGEKVTTAVIFTSDTAKINIPVTVQFKPTFIKGLSPALVSLVLFLLPAEFGMGCIQLQKWLAASREMSDMFATLFQPSGSFLIVMLLFLSVLLVSLVPTKYTNKYTVSSYLLFCIALSLCFSDYKHGIGHLETFFQPTELLAQFILLFAILLVGTGLLFGFIRLLSPQQRQDSRLMIYLSFFVIPAILFFARSMAVSGLLLKFSPPVFLMAIGVTSFFFLALHIAIQKAEQRELLEQEEPYRSKGVKFFSNVVVVLIGFFAWMISLDMKPGKVMSLLDMIKDSILVKISSYWHLTSMLDKGHMGVNYLIFIAISLLVAVGLYFFLRRQLVVKVLLAVFLFFSLVDLSILVMVLGEGAQKSFYGDINLAPLTASKYFANRKDDMGVYFKELDYSYNMMKARKYERYARALNDAYKKFLAKSKGKDSDTDLRFRLMLMQVNFYAANGRNGKLKVKMPRGVRTPALSEQNPFDFLPVDLFQRMNRFSRSGLSYFNSHENDYFLPDCYFCMMTPDGPVIFTSDYTVLAAIRFYMGYNQEVAGNVEVAQKDFHEAEALLNSTERSAPFRYLQEDLAVRHSLAAGGLETGEKRLRYLKGVVAHYLDGDNWELGMSLMVPLIRENRLGISDRADIIDRLSRTKAPPETQMRVVERLGASKDPEFQRYMEALIDIRKEQFGRK